MEFVGYMNIINTCRKFGKRLRAMKLFPCLVISLWIDISCCRSGGCCWQAMTSCLCEAQMWIFSFIWWCKIKQPNNVLMPWKCSKQAKHIQTTSLQLVPDARDLAVERLSQASSVRPHTSTDTIQPSPLPSDITGSLWETDGKVYSAFYKYFSKLWRGRNLNNHKNDELATQLTYLSKSSPSLSSSHPDTHINKYWLFQLLCLSWCWASRANNWTTTALAEVPIIHPHLCLPIQNCFLHMGGPGHFKAPHVGAPVGWQAATAQLSRTALVSAKRTHVGNWVLVTSGFDWVRKTESCT